MITGLVPPNGFGLPRIAFILRYLPAKSKSSRSDQIILMTSIHSCAFVTLLVRALLDAEHVELALVPADDDVEPKAALADMIGCDHFLRRDYRIEDRRMHLAPTVRSPR